MKILKLHFKNLNSLVGEWTIDFTDAEYSEQGIFAITGPTGAGKSTILDAICLALYGRTPRLERINASQNEIMSRQCGECFASLEFQTSSGTYRTLWSQARARKKADGNLQNAQHIIEDCVNNKTLEDKLSKTPQAVTEVTGMDFEHFTRAMLLAQGGFAKFLQSSADERSPILEKITGTEIYSQISKLVHERKTSEENVLNNINARLAGINLLNSQEIDGLQAELAELTQQITTLITNKSTLEQQQTWLINLQKLGNELIVIQQAQQQLQIQQEQFAADELRLKDAKLVEEINSDIYIQLQELRKQLTTIKANLSANQEQLPKLQELLTTQQTQVSQVHSELLSYKTNYALNLKILQQVRLLDAEILTKQDGLAKATTKLNTSRSELDKLLTEQQGFAKQQINQQQQQVQIDNYLTEHHADATLLGAYSGICAELDNLLTLDSKLKGNQIEQISTQDKHDKLIELITEQESTQTKYSTQQGELNSQITQLQQTIQQLANGKNVAMLKDEILQLNSQHTDYQELARQLQEKANLALKLQQVRTELTNERQSSTEIKPQLERDNELLGYTTQLLDNLTAQKLLQSKIISLSDERANLQANQPCPLCGGLDHPYAQDGVAVNNELDTQIAQAKTKIGQLQATLNTLNTQLATNNANIAKLSEQQNELISRQELLQQSITNLVGKYGLTISQISDTFIHGQLSAIAEQINQLNQQIKTLQDCEQQLADYQAKLQELEKSLHEIKLNFARLTEQKFASEKHLAELAHEINQSSGEYDKLSNVLMTRLTSYQVPIITSATIPAIKDNLAKRRDAWQNTEQQANTLKQELQKLAHQLEQNSSLQIALNRQITEQQHEVSTLQQSVNELTTNRSTLFGDKNTDAAETQWQQELQALEEKAKAAETEFNQLSQQQTALIALIEKDRAQLQTLQTTQTQLETQFIARLNLVNIASEAEFIAKRLSRDEMMAIGQTADNLKQQAIELASRLKQTSEALANEQAKQLTDKAHDELQTEIDNIQTNYEHSNQRIGEIRGQLSANQQAQEQQQDTLALRDKQLIITERYRRLHVLIGSSDGKKFRNFAQGLTFDLVVKHANQQLHQMSDRYLLIRDNDAPLELNVIDNYQGGEIRTTKNLSGGESFVISLALALGLSKLSSNKVQVDSLFLDEGFGTLDEDSLQTALDALDSLQRDGKLIGVISHVGALKEQINLQIQVEALSGGVSKISGIGCSRKD
ncbi:MAG: AAA family ATPase [Burkholderiales bacterium]|nr:AAA family ATPase [Burkholderiales bacterium]